MLKRSQPFTRDCVEQTEDLLAVPSIWLAPRELKGYITQASAQVESRVLRLCCSYLLHNAQDVEVRTFTSFVCVR